MDLTTKRNALMNSIASSGGSHDLVDFLNRELVEFESDEVTIIYYAAFYNQTALEKVSLPNVTAMEGAMGSGLHFRYCTALRHLNLPSLVSQSGGSNFRNCTSIKVIYLPKFTSSSNGIFWDCTSLEKCIVPYSDVIGGYTFENCTSLKLVDSKTSRISGAIPSLETFINRYTASVAKLDDVSYIPNDTCQFYVPSSLVASYKTANVWKDLTNIENRVHAIEGSPYESTTWFESTQEYRTEVLGE